MKLEIGQRKVEDVEQVLVLWLEPYKEKLLSDGEFREVIRIYARRKYRDDGVIIAEISEKGIDLYPTAFGLGIAADENRRMKIIS